MANETINIDILINASKSAKTLKEQRQALKDLKDGLEDVKYGSGAFELLTEETNRLTQSMGNLNLKFEDVYGDIQPLTGRIGELEDRMYELALAGQQNTQEFRDLQAEAIRMRKVIIDVDSTVDAFAEKGARLNSIIGVVNGITAAFTVAQGAVNLFGNENQDVEKALLKVQSAMAVLNGLQEIQRLVTEKNIIVQRILNGVMKVNPIFLLAGVLTTVIGLWKVFSSETKDLKGEVDKLNSSLQLQQDILEYNSTLSKQNSEAIIALAEAEGKSEKELLDLKLNLLQQEKLAEAERWKNAKDAITEFKKIRSDAIFDGDKEAQQAAQDEIDRNQKVVDAIELDFKERAGYANKYEFEKALLQKKFNKEEIDRINEITENNKKSVQKRIDDLKELEDKVKEFNKTYLDETIKLNDELIGSQSEFSSEYEKQWDGISNSYNKARVALGDFINSQELIYDDYYKRGIITQERYNELSSELRNKQHELFNKNEAVFIRKQINLQQQLGDETLKKQQENSLKLIQNSISESEKNKLIKEKELITSSEFATANEEDKQKMLSELDNKYTIERNNKLIELNNKRKEILEANYLAESSIAEKNIATFKTNIKIAEENVDDYKGYLETTSNENVKLQQKLSNTTNKNIEAYLKKQIEANDRIITSTKHKIETEETYLNNSIKSYEASIEDKEVLTVDYNKNVNEADKEITQKQIDNQKIVTKTTEEQLENRKTFWQKLRDYIKEHPIETAEAIANQFASSLEAIDAFITSSENRRISFIQQESDLRLEAIDKERQAYLNSVTEQTNAEKFKAAKLKEFDDKAAIEQKTRDREIAEAQYKGEIRKWEYSYLEAIVNLGKSLLGAAANPFQLAVVAGLGVTQLASIQANKPNPPQFGKGGLLEGPSHSQGGIQTSFGELEGGEAVINKKSTKAFLPVLDSINQAYGGVPLMNKKTFKNGGVLSSSNNIDTTSIEMILMKYMDRPIKTYVTSSDMTQQQKSDNVLKNRTTF